MNLQLLIPALGWALLYFLWQGLALGALAALGLWLLRGADARGRYAVCALALLACVGIPCVHLLYLLAAEELPQSGFSVTTLNAWMPSLVLAWSAGVALMSLRLLLGLAWVARLRRQAVAAPAVWQQRLDTLALRMRLPCPIPLRLHGALASPVTVGFFRPLVLLPASLLSGMPVPLLEALLAHELAHVRRWDYLLNLLQSVAEALLFFHPVVWWLSARLRVERELVADALAAQSLPDPAQLASALHQLSLQAGTRQQGGLLLSARGGTLLTRIQRLMAPAPLPGRAGWKLVLPALLLAGATLLMQAQRQPAPDAKQLVQAAAGMLALPVSARHMLVIDEASGKVLMAKDADTIVPIASITKLMTGLVVVLAQQDMHEVLTVTDADVDTEKHTSSRLRVGASMTRGDLLHIALMSSENRAASALGRNYPGGITAFVAAMNAKALQLGMMDTRYVDSSGLSSRNVASARDLAKLAMVAHQEPLLREYSTDPKYQVDAGGRIMHYSNTNYLVTSPDWQIGLQKTGFINEAGRCLVMQTMIQGRAVIMVFLDSKGKQSRTADAGRMRRWLEAVKSPGVG